MPLREDDTVSSKNELESFYAGQVDPWHYADDPYERGKYAATLATSPRERYAAGLEIGCSEGVFTREAAERVDWLLGIDVSAVAVDRARAHCADLSGVAFRQVDFIDDELAERFDVIFCSEVLYYIPPWKRGQVARKIAGWLKPGGDLVLVHTWRETTREWGDIYGEGGAERLHRLFTGVVGLPVVAERGTDDYQILVVRSAPTAIPHWRRRAEAIRLGALAVFPTARMLVRNRLWHQPRVRRLMARVGWRSGWKDEDGQDT
jgi:SAM-dependent methyltransferase